MNFHLAWSPTMIMVVSVLIVIAGFFYKKKFAKKTSDALMATAIAFIIMGYLAIHVGTPQSELKRERFDKKPSNTSSEFVDNDRITRDDADKILKENVRETVDNIKEIN